MTNQTPESTIDDSVVEAAYRAFCEARMGRTLSDDEHDALRSRLELTWIKPTIAAALRATNMLREPSVTSDPNRVTEAKQPEEWSTEDRQESKREAERRWSRPVAREAEQRYQAGSINGFILGAEWQKARETFISYKAIADEAKARIAEAAKLHRVEVSKNGYSWCAGCSTDEYAEDWPCPTAVALGLNEGEKDVS